jgi:hypothetical protein
MAICSVDKCKKTAFKDGLCTVHMPKAPKSDAPVYTVVLGRSKGSTSPNSSFASLAESKTPSQPYKNRIEHLRASGPNSGGEEQVHGVACLHDTQKANNVTVWYSWMGKAMTVWGLGSHSGGSGAGNAKYAMLWFDGTNKSWTRA